MAIDEIAKPVAMKYQLRKRADVPNIMIAVSKDDHCLVSLLTKWKSGVLPINIVAIISNHQDCQALSEWHRVPFYHLPLAIEATHEKTVEAKTVQEAKIVALMTEHNIDLLVLARYMQILSNDLCQKLQGKAINIHHSFLPSFKGARPYHQAHARGVKVIGATAHYVTADLDEGPIIAQEVKPINHTFTIEQMVHMGHDLEATALSHAVRMHAEQRVCLNGVKTVTLA